MITFSLRLSVEQALWSDSHLIVLFWVSFRVEYKVVSLHVILQLSGKASLG